jgi:hypothetical protein
MPHGALLAAPHEQFRAIREESFEPNKARVQVALVYRLLQAFECHGATLRKLRHRGATQLR